MPNLQWLSGKCLTEIQKIQVQTPAGPQCFFFTKKKNNNQSKKKKTTFRMQKQTQTTKKPSVWKKQTNQPTNQQTNKPTNQQTNKQTNEPTNKQKINKKQGPHLLFFERSVL